MCNEDLNHNGLDNGFRKQIQKLKGLAKALHCPTRWDIIDIIGTEEAKTREIRKKLGSKGYDLGKSGLYYHLSELREAGLIEVVDYIEEGRGAPEKVWKLTREEIKIKLVKDEGD
ncbi:MAG: Transcriptional regulator containing HTH domain ArsR family [Candidatus Methanohalarchaeum thermophilum]|uniref:Transcriptional regulator containing HTH domain ArsR family n=1 Tax=Methanohalarchaeum thermophilum TaxID=1903181 RepID=A0A1Q6DXL4_METT1|nr:MAG: Transcriptional regulator containing HTH domain ArsR family [Candidatus Methanohalarchaeum thermophilum]